MSLFTREFSTVSDIRVELISGAPVLHATVPNKPRKIALPNVSGAINRIASIVLAMRSTPGSVVLVDEMENGIYYKHQQEVWRTIIDCAREYNCQLLTSTHSLEWLKAMINAANRKTFDLALWRLEMDSKGNPDVFTFSGATLAGGIEYGSDPRASLD